MKTEVIDKLSALITAAFGLVAALAWNDAIKALFKGPCGTETSGQLCALWAGGPWVYAIIITVIAVSATIWIGRIADRAHKAELRILKRQVKEDLEEDLEKKGKKKKSK